MHITRRNTLAAAAALGGSACGLLAAPRTALAQDQEPLPVASAAEVRRVIDGFVAGAKTSEQGLLLDVPALADNPAAVPVRVVITQPITEQRWCEQIILVAERNPAPLACTLHFLPTTGTAEASVRLRLAQTQTLHALARMSDGQVLHLSREVTAAASGCGM